jgi:hypothetical protein
MSNSRPLIPHEPKHSKELQARIKKFGFNYLKATKPKPSEKRKSRKGNNLKEKLIKTPSPLSGNITPVEELAATPVNEEPLNQSPTANCCFSFFKPTPKPCDLAQTPCHPALVAG